MKHSLNTTSNLLRLICLCGLFLWAALAQAAGKQAIGWLEYVHIDEADIRLEAKIDTGADSSSIKAEILEKFTRGGKNWIRFRVEDEHGHKVVIERRITRHVKIKRKMAPSIRRPVVKLGICLGNVYRVSEVTLAERKGFEYHMLIGRNYLHGVFLVDSAREHTTQPSCPGVGGD